MDESDRNRPGGAIAGEDFHTDFREEMGYGGYLGLDAILGAQKPVSDSHDEMLFIIVHQATELWLKLVLHELGAAVRHLRADDLAPAFKMLARVSRIQEQLIQSWTVLSTMTPVDYLEFRDALGHASGFQSRQYRSLEFLMGNKDRAYMKPFGDNKTEFAALEAILEAPSLYDECIRLLARRGFAIDKSQTERDWSLKREPDESVQAAWLEIYRNTEKHWDLYELAEELVDLEDAFQTWRFRHVTTVERVIGFKRGTGGTSGVAYLKRVLDIRFFPEVWAVRTEL